LVNISFFTQDVAFSCSDSRDMRTVASVIVMLLFVHFYVQIGNVLLAIGPLLCGIDFV